MKNKLISYFPLSKDYFTKLWEECVFILDSNILLDLYRYSESTRVELLDILTKLKDRIWIPHQVALEFSKRRPYVILEQEALYDNAVKKITKIQDSVAKTLDQDQDFQFRIHPALDKDKIKNDIKLVLDKLCKDIQSHQDKHPDYLKDEDPILKEILEITEDRVGEKYSYSELTEYYKQGELRYKEKIPPGYMDSDKSGVEKYGDLIIWFQIIDYAKENNKPIIFLTNDIKEDWRWIIRHKDNGCRPELIEEIREKANVSYYHYTSNKFLKYAKEELEYDVEQNSIEETQHMLGYDYRAIREYLEKANIYYDNPTYEIFGLKIKDIEEQVKKYKESLGMSEYLNILNELKGVTNEINMMSPNSSAYIKSLGMSEYLNKLNELKGVINKMNMMPLNLSDIDISEDHDENED